LIKLVANFALIKEAFEAALIRFQDGRFETARTAFEKLNLDTNDECAGMYVQRCDQMIASDTSDWTGVTVFSEH